MVNDSYGHHVGDSVLRMVARTMMKNARPYDLFGRWGGEEFIGVIRNVNRVGLSDIANRVRLLVEKSYLEIGQKTICTTLSMGATIAKAQDTLISLVTRADKLMYQSKKDGKNRLCAD
jgi:diguanylate cyclase (GGDEF)-like protein